jgi:hypothetical protein
MSMLYPVLPWKMKNLFRFSLIALVVAFGTLINTDVYAEGENQGNPTIIDKLDQLIDAEECRDAWDKVLTTDRFELVMNGAAVRDNETGLVWEQSPDITGGPNSDGLRSWHGAQVYCFQSEVGGRGGWRLPTIAELTSLKDTNPALPGGPPFSNVQLLGFNWSVTTSNGIFNRAWLVDFASGQVGTGPKADIQSAWCVRGGQGHDAFPEP